MSAELLSLLLMVLGIGIGYNLGVLSLERAGAANRPEGPKRRTQSGRD